MHVIIRNSFLDRLYDYICTLFSFVRKKDELLLLKCEKNALVFYINAEVFYAKFELPECEELIIEKEGFCVIEINFLSTLLQVIEFKNKLEIYQAEDNCVQFFSGDFSCTLLLLDGVVVKEDEFKVTEGEGMLIHYSVLKDVFSRLKELCKTSESSLNPNPVFSCIHIKNNLENKQLEFWATDTFRIIYGSFNYLINKPINFNISINVLNVVLGIMKDTKVDELMFWYENDYFTLKSDTVVFKTKIDSRNYPNLEKWFSNSEENKRFLMNKDDLVAAIDRNMLFMGKDMKHAHYVYENGGLSLEYKDHERGYCKEFLIVSPVKNERFEFHINNYLLKNLLKTIPSKEISFSFSKQFEPLVINTPPEDKDEFKQLILPIKND